MPDLAIHRWHQPSINLADAAQSIGYEAWSDRLDKRSDDEIRHVFNPDSEEMPQILYEQMAKRIGRFVGVMAFSGDEKIGFAWATDDVGTQNPLLQRLKHLGGTIFHKKPYAWTAQLNVRPEYQKQGVGSALLVEVLKPFELDQPATAYTFEENQYAFNWLLKRGFEPIPTYPVDPNIELYSNDLYFGSKEHVSQWRLEAPGTRSVIVFTRQHQIPDYSMFDHH
jgi:GNAT superfamily N-acetyltransferase